jgi:hypothetical protein
MFDIPEKGKDIVISFLKEKFVKKEKSLSQSGTKTGVLGHLREKAQIKRLLLSKSLIVKL